MKNPVFARTLILIGAAIFIIAVGVFLLTRNSSSPSSMVQPQIKIATEKIPSQTTKSYTDDTGFSFDYPDDLVVVKKESTSSASYSNIELTSKAVSGAIRFAVEDTKEKTISNWFTKNIASGAATKDIKLGKLDAKEFTDKNITTAVIDQGILFRLDVMPEQEAKYWQNAYKAILSSFSFTNPQSANSSSSSNDVSGGEEDIITEEDTIE